MSGRHSPPRWWRRLGRRTPVEKPRPLMPQLVEGATGVEHWLTPEAFEQGLREHTGFYLVLCGRRIPVASMVTPPGPSCLPCQQARETRTC
jgi:hypothetical protein